MKNIVTLTDDLTRCKKTEWMFEQSNKDLYFLFEDDVDLLGKFDWCAERDKTTVLVMEHTIYNIYYIYHYKLYCLLLKIMLPF